MLYKIWKNIKTMAFGKDVLTYTRESNTYEFPNQLDLMMRCLVTSCLSISHSHPQDQILLKFYRSHPMIEDIYKS